MIERTIPSTGERLSVIGCGTWSVFDVGRDPAVREPLGHVLDVLFDAGGTVVDSSPMYGKAEGVAGDLLAARPAEPKPFIATKVWTRGKAAGIAQMERSFELLRTAVVDLMQIHNLLDWRTHLDTLREWKASGRVRYIGVTHYTSSGYDELEAVLRRETVDFVQLNYSLDEREAEQRLLPLALDCGIAVLVNRPLGGGGLIRSFAGRAVPKWAEEVDCTSWAQLCLKFVIAHPAVTCVIPASGKPEHMRDDVAAGRGRLPDAEMRARIASAR